MQVDDSGWRDLEARLGATALSTADRETLIAYLTARLVGHFGADAVSCQNGKSDPTQHSMNEVAAAALAHLAPIIDALPTAALAEVIASLDPPAPPPWHDDWRSDSRTASWRS